MVHVLGVNLNGSWPVRFALTKFYGIGSHMAHRLCARLQVHDTCTVSRLSGAQITGLATFLSNPTTFVTPHYPLAAPDFVPLPPDTSMKALHDQFMERRSRRSEQKPKAKTHIDPLNRIKVQSELKTEMRENIAHQRMIASYVGKRHAMHLPVRGQNTQTNAKNAKLFNRLDRAR